jgi:hypothetical protein
MSQKSSVPQAISFVSQVLKRDTRGPGSQESGTQAMSANGLGIEPDEFVVAFDNVSSIPFCAILDLFPRAREGPFAIVDDSR